MVRTGHRWINARTRKHTYRGVDRGQIQAGGGMVSLMEESVSDGNESGESSMDGLLDVEQDPTFLPGELEARAARLLLTSA